MKSLPFHILEAHQGLANVYFWRRHSDHSSAKSMEELWSLGFGIAFMDGTRDLALLWNGIREIATLKPRDPGFLTAKILKLNSTLAVSNDWKTGNLSWAFPSRWHVAAVRQRSQTRLRWQELERCLLISTTEKCNQGVRSPLSRQANEMDEAAPEIKTTKKALLSTICLAAMKIQKNSHLVMTTTKGTMMLVTFTNLWPARPTSFSERFLGLENYSSQQRVAEGVKTTRSNRLKFGLLKTLLDGCDCALSYYFSE